MGWVHVFMDGAPMGGADWNTDWTQDDSPGWATRLTPDSNDKIYDFDDPNIENLGQTVSYEKYCNFRQYIEWNETLCSPYEGWFYRARRKEDQTPKITLHEAGTGWRDLPDNPFYP